MNPPPNAGTVFDPPQNPANPPPPPVGLIVRQDAADKWMDDNGGDWTSFVSGPQAALSGRPAGWDLVDHDLAIIDSATLDVSYVRGLMNLCMAVAVNPSTGAIAVVGTDALNQIRFEPKLNGRFLRVELGLVPADLRTPPSVIDLNPHLTYRTPTVPQAQRDLSLGDPRGIVWNHPGTRGYIAGMGSNNVVVVDAAGNRAGLTPAVEVGEGPTGLALDEARSRLYVLDKFEAAISVVDTLTETELTRVPFHDPAPQVIRVGRRHLYGTHETSGTGHVACASCHPDARMDRLAWDLGNPAGEVKLFNQNCNFEFPDPFFFLSCPDWHPMKGPMATQTLQDIIGKEPHHWRGDRDGLEEFNQTFTNLQGDDEMLSPEAMQELEDFLATIHFPPNPFRDFDNSLPALLVLPGHYYTGKGGPSGTPLVPGNAQSGHQVFDMSPFLMDEDTMSCAACHTLPTGIATNDPIGHRPPIPEGPNGELHHAVIFSALDVSPTITIKVPQLRNLHEKVGFELTQQQSLAGFGFIHDGSVDSLARFMSEPPFKFNSQGCVNDGCADVLIPHLVAFMLSFSGSNMAVCNGFPGHACGPLSQDTHAAVGTQVTIDGSNDLATGNRIAQMIGLVDAGPGSVPGPQVGLVVKGLQDGLQRGYVYVGGGVFQSDRSGEAVQADALRAAAGEGSELSYTLVAQGTETRIGVDRDLDGARDRDELDACSDPSDASSLPGADVAVPRLVLARSGASAKLSWSDAGASWDVLVGDLDVLRATGGDFTAAVLACLADDSTHPLVVYDGSSAPQAAFFLVRAACAGGTTYESGGLGQVGLRDEEIDASSRACAGPTPARTKSG